jgi:hypothetical protein
MNKNYICSTYFSNNIDPQRNKTINYDDYLYIKDWYESIIKLNLNAIIFYDNLSKEFIKKYTNSNIKFIHAEQASLNTVDFRWIIYKNYFERNKNNFDNVFFTDVSDVIILNNPFDFILDKPNTIFIGDEKPPYSYKWWMAKRNIYFHDIIPDFIEYENRTKNNIIYNCGIIGGDINIILDFLSDMVNILLKGNVKTTTVDMSVANYLIYTKYKNNFFAGYPLNTPYKFNEIRKDCYFKHK